VRHDVPHAYRVAGDEELRAGCVGPDESSPAGLAALHAERPAVFGAQVGESAERSGLPSVPPNPNPPKQRRSKRFDVLG